MTPQTLPHFATMTAPTFLRLQLPFDDSAIAEFINIIPLARGNPLNVIMIHLSFARIREQQRPMVLCIDSSLV